MHGFVSSSMRVAELYGTGSFLLGARGAGQEPVYACVGDKYEKKVVEANFDVVVSIGMDGLQRWDIPRADLVYVRVPGPSEIVSITQTLAMLNPRFVVMAAFDEALAKQMDLMDYVWSSDEYDPAEFRLPQTRRRSFWVYRKKDMKPDEVFLFPDGMEASRPQYPLSTILEDDPEGMASTGGGRVLAPSDLLVTFPKNYQDYYNILVDQGKGPRRFSVLEAKRAMGFPDDFEMPVPRKQAYRIIGDAAWPPAIEAITRELVEWASL